MYQEPTPSYGDPGRRGENNQGLTFRNSLTTGPSTLPPSLRLPWQTQPVLYINFTIVLLLVLTDYSLHLVGYNVPYLKYEWGSSKEHIFLNPPYSIWAIMVCFSFCKLGSVWSTCLSLLTYFKGVKVSSKVCSDLSLFPVLKGFRLKLFPSLFRPILVESRSRKELSQWCEQILILERWDTTRGTNKILNRSYGLIVRM